MATLPHSLIIICNAFSTGTSNDDAPDFALFELTPALMDKMGRMRVLVSAPDLVEVATEFEPAWDRPLPTSRRRLTVDADGFHCGAADQEIAAYYETERVHWGTLEREIALSLAEGRPYVLLGYQERADRVPCIKVEYDPAYTGGGAYTGVGRTVALPEAMVEVEPGDDDEQVAAVFQRLTGLEPRCIIHIEREERFTLTLNPFDNDWIE